MVPLGILTAITGAIRVQGPRIANSFIGRGRENRALAEIELMSSTSQEVCELFNGKSIVRAMGRPEIAQILVYPTEYTRLKKDYDEIDRARLVTAPPDESNDGPRSKAADKDVAAEAIPPVFKNTGDETVSNGIIRGNDNSCGIHTLETATSGNDSGDSLLQVQSKQISLCYVFNWKLIGAQGIIAIVTKQLSDGLAASPAQRILSRRIRPSVAMYSDNLGRPIFN